MKVLIIPSWYLQKDNPISGIFFREQALALHENGIETLMMVPEVRSIKTLFQSKKLLETTFELDQGMPTYKKTTALHVPRVNIVQMTIRKQMAISMMKEIIKKHGKPDVIHAHSILYGGWVGSILSKQFNVPLVITEHSSAFPRKLILPDQVPVVKETLQQTTKILAVGEGLMEELKNYTDKEISYIPNIVDVEKVSNYSSFATCEKGKFVFFTLSLLSKNKRVDNIIRAFSIVSKSKKDAELWVGGSGAELENLKNLVSELHLDNNVKFLGRLDREQVYQRMNSCDAFISASEVETFGVVLIEALAAGKPVIATKSGGPNLIINDKNGLLVPVNDVERLASAMINMSENYSSFDATVIKEDCISKYSKNVVCEKLVDIYTSVLN